MTHFAAQVQEALAAVRRAWDGQPLVGIILGSGLGGFVEQIEVERAIPFDRVPHFSRSTADGHDGRIVFGRVAGVPAVTMSGRCHFYEGYTAEQVTRCVRLMKELGVELLILSNASGGMNPGFRLGDVMVIADHINLMSRRFAADLSAIPCAVNEKKPTSYYCPQLVERALASAHEGGFSAYRGVYAAMTGPNYETRAEYRMLRAVGADAVGMSTVPEAIVATRCGMRVLALSTITNLCHPDRLLPARHEEVLAAAETAEPKVRRIILDVIAGEIKPTLCRDRPGRRSVGRDETATTIGDSGTPLRAYPTERFVELTTHTKRS
jgi:purine-nucleoside phosphorylase